MMLGRWKNVWSQWKVLSYYQRFESSVAFILTIIIGLIILVALYRLSAGVVMGLLLGALDPLDHRMFQDVFGEIMTLLIALEFNHTLQYVVTHQQSIIQTKVILLITLLALARKLIILDLHEVTAGQLLGLAAVTLALGVIYWLMRERDDRLAAAAQNTTSQS
ncbi:MAG: phosphate-starvation-inducible PsiE family protein [Pseudomonadota bacterium]